MGGTSLMEVLQELGVKNTTSLGKRNGYELIIEVVESILICMIIFI